MKGPPPNPGLQSGDTLTGRLVGALASSVCLIETETFASQALWKIAVFTGGGRDCAL